MVDDNGPRVSGEPVPTMVPPVGASHHCKVPGPAAVAVKVTIPVPHRVTFEDVGAAGTLTTVMVTEDVLVQPIGSVTNTVYVKFPAVTGVNTGLLIAGFERFVTGVHE